MQFFLRVLNGRAVRVSHLCPSGHAGLDAVAQGVERDFLRQLIDKERALRPRPDQAHVAAQHIQQLGQFVNAQAPNDLPYACHAVIVCARPTRFAVFFGISPHAAELGNAESSAVLPHTLLTVEHWARTFDLDQYRCDQHQRRSQHTQQGCAQDVEHALDAGSHRALIESVAKNKPAGAQEIYANLAQGFFEVRVQVVNLGARDFAVQQLTQRHAAGAALGQCHHDLVHSQPVGHARQGVVDFQNLVRWDCRFALVGAGQIAHDFGVGVCGPKCVADHQGGWARTENHDAGAASGCARGM